jgi:hypothetical protein
MDKVVKVTLWVPGQDALNQVLGAAQVSIECGAPRRESDGTFAVTLYASPVEAKKLAALPFRQEADDTFGDVLAARQKEVSKTDRFKGGKVKPTGLGVKR